MVDYKCICNFNGYCQNALRRIYTDLPSCQLWGRCAPSSGCRLQRASVCRGDGLRDCHLRFPLWAGARSCGGEDLCADAPVASVLLAQLFLSVDLFLVGSQEPPTREAGLKTPCTLLTFFHGDFLASDGVMFVNLSFLAFGLECDGQGRPRLGSPAVFTAVNKTPAAPWDLRLSPRWGVTQPLPDLGGAYHSCADLPVLPHGFAPSLWPWAALPDLEGCFGLPVVLSLGQRCAALISVLCNLFEHLAGLAFPASDFLHTRPFPLRRICLP